MLVGDLNLLKCLGKGAFGEVYLTTKQGSNIKYATKKIDKSVMKNPKSRQYLENEINILKEMDHPNIIKLIEVVNTTKYYYLVMEYCNGGDLAKCLAYYKNKNQKPFSEEVVQYLMRQIVSGICYLHKKNILHRDIKLENILVNFDNEKDAHERNMMKAKIKIIDFGFAIHLPSQCSTTFSAVGTFLYMDPKILEKFNQKAMQDKKRGYGKEVDIWSLGCICYGLYRGKYPFQANNFAELIDKINYGKYSLPKTASKEIYSFLDKMLQYDGKARLSAEELINHPFLTTNPKILLT
jgi:calcium-dependent protein kinase